MGVQKNLWMTSTVAVMQVGEVTSEWKEKMCI
jgi:hypothetical protein